MGIRNVSADDTPPLSNELTTESQNWVKDNFLYQNVHSVSKNDSDVAHYKFNARQPTLVIFGRDIAERICY